MARIEEEGILMLPHLTMGQYLYVGDWQEHDSTWTNIINGWDMSSILPMETLTTVADLIVSNGLTMLKLGMRNYGKRQTRD